MFQLTIVPVNSSAVAGVYYKTKENAEAALKKTYSGGNIDLNDDFGNQFRMPADNFLYAMLIDCARSPHIQFEKILDAESANVEIKQDPRYIMSPAAQGIGREGQNPPTTSAANGSLIRPA